MNVDQFISVLREKFLTIMAKSIKTYLALASRTPATVSGAGRSSVRNNKLSSWPHSAEPAPVDWAEVGRPDRERLKIRIVSPKEKKLLKLSKLLLIP